MRQLPIHLHAQPMLNALKLLGFLWIGFTISPAVANDNLITWYKPEFPPLSIVNGPHAGKGYSDKLEAFLMGKLATYDHKVLVAPFKRTTRDMKMGLRACSVTLLKTPEREQYIAFTKPARLLLPNSLIVRKRDQSDFLPFMDGAGKVSVEALIRDSDLKLGFSNGRSYTAPLDRLLATYKTNQSLVERLGKEGPKGLLAMLAKERIDAMFAQPVEARFHGQSMGLEKTIAVLPIQEIKAYTVGYIGCSNTDWGRKVIDEINVVLDQAVKEPEFRSFYEGFLDADSAARYRAIYAQFFDQSS